MAGPIDDTVRQLVLERLGPSGNGEGDPASTDMVAALGARGADPIMTALLASMLNRQAEPGPADEQAETEQKLERARAVIRKLKRDLATAETMARYIAGTFGACQSCWGLSMACPQCQGRGGPGFIEPNEEELLAWVGPALRRLGLEVARQEGSTP